MFALLSEDQRWGSWGRQAQIDKWEKKLQQLCSPLGAPPLHCPVLLFLKHVDLTSFVSRGNVVATAPVISGMMMMACEQQQRSARPKTETFGSAQPASIIKMGHQQSFTLLPKSQKVAVFPDHRR